MAVLRSMKDLWVLISGTSLLQAKELVGTELESNSDRILNGILFYKKQSSDSNGQLEKLVTEKHQLQFVDKICQLLKIDEVQCYTLFCSYLLYEYKGTRENLETTLKSERHSQILLQEVWNYYYGERFYALLCMKQVFCHWQDDNHPYQDLYEGFLEIINKEGDIANKIIAQLVNVNNAEIPNRESYGTNFNDGLLYRWVVYNLKEQLEILQILILLFKDTEPTTENLKEIFTVFQKHSFGQKLLFRHYINDAVQDLVDTIGFMESVLFVECLELEWLQNCSESNSNEHYLLKDRDTLQNLDRVICCLGNHPQHGPILLSWMLLRHWSKDFAMGDRSVVAQLGKCAIKLKVFEYMSTSLKLPLVHGDGVVPNLINTIVYSLMSILLSTFEIRTFGDSDNVNGVAERALCYHNTARDFWKKGLEQGLGHLLNASLSIFPVEISPTLRLLTSLAKAGPESAEKVMDLMRNLPSYCEAVNEFTDSITVHDQWQLVRDKRPYLNNSVVIRHGTIGELVGNCQKSGRPLVRWHQVVNGWQICLLETRVLLNSVTVSDCVTSEFVGRISNLAELVGEMVMTKPSSMSELEDLLQLLLITLSKLSLLPQPPTKLLASILDVVSAFSKHCYDNVCHHLLNNNFLPFLTGNCDSIEELASGVYCDIGVVGRQVALQEQASGNYDLLLSFLNLMDKEEFLKDDKNTFLPCLVFVFRDIFPNHHKWRYVKQGIRETIGVKCLNIFHKLLQLTDWERQRKLNKSQEVCVYSLLRTEASNSLLRIVSTGEHVIRSAMEQQGCQSQGLGQQLTSLVRLSLSVLNRLLLLRNSIAADNKTGSGQQQSILEQSLLALPSQPNQLHLILGVAYYAFQRYDPRLAALAVQLLRRCAQDYPMSLLACLGNEASAVRDLFLLRLKSPSEDIRLKVAIIRFLTSCVRKQPGLLEMFVNVKVDVDGNEKSLLKDEEENCLECAIQILKRKKRGSGFCPRDLHCAVVEFLHSLWAAHHLLAIEELKKEPTLWSILCDPLLKDDSLDSIDCRIIAFILHTLALQGFHRNVFGEAQIDSGVKAVFKEIQEKKLVTKWSKYIRSLVPSTFDLELSQQQLDSSLLSDQTKDTFLLLLSWRDFLTILAKENLIEVSNEERKVVMNDILSTLLNEIESNSNHHLLNLLAELYLHLLRSWKSCIKSWDEWFSKYAVLLDRCSSNVNQSHPKTITAIISVAIYGLKDVEKIEEKSILEDNWTSSVCLLVQNLSKLAYVAVKNNDNQILMLCSMGILLLKELTEIIENEYTYQPFLSKYLIIPTLISLLESTLQQRKGGQLAQSISLFFVSVSSSSLTTAENLRTAGLLPRITLPLLSTYETKEIEQKGSDSTWRDVFGLSLQITANLLDALHHFGLNDTFNFVGVHLDEIASIIHQVALKPSVKSVENGNQACSLVLALAKHRQEWHLQHVSSYQLLMSMVCDTTVSVIGYLIRPNLLQHIVERQNPLESRKVPLLLVDHSDLASSSRRFSSGTELWEKASPELLQVQNQLLAFLGLSVSTLECFSPSLFTILGNPNGDPNEWCLFLDTNFSSPSVEYNAPLGFGSVLACVNFCLQSKGKNETPQNRNLLSYILEKSLVLLVSQGLVCQLSAVSSTRDQQLIKRELNAEMCSLSLVLSRAIRNKDGCSFSPSSLDASSKMLSDTNRSFLKFVIYVIEKIFK